MVEEILVFGVLVAALALRLPDVAAVPPDVHGDEGAVGIDARALLLREQPNVFALGWYAIPELSYGIAALSMKVFGNDLFGLRMHSVILGLLSILIAYFLFRRLFGPRTALIAACLLAFAQWHIHLSRIGINYMQALLAILLALFFTIRTLDTLILVPARNPAYNRGQRSRNWSIGMAQSSAFLP